MNKNKKEAIQEFFRHYGREEYSPEFQKEKMEEQELRAYWKQRITNEVPRPSIAKYFIFGAVLIGLLLLVYYVSQLKPSVPKPKVHEKTEGVLYAYVETAKNETRKSSGNSSANAPLDSLHKLLITMPLDYDKVLRQLNRCDSLNKITYDDSWWIKANVYYAKKEYGTAHGYLDKLIEDNSRVEEAKALKQKIDSNNH